MSREKQDFMKITKCLGWSIKQINSEGLNRCDLHMVEKGEVSHTFGFLQNQSTNREYYSALESRAEIIFVGGYSFDKDSTFSKECKVPVVPSDEFLYVMTDWNMENEGVEPELLDSESDANNDKRGSRILKRQNQLKKTIHIVEENPIEQIYTQLRALSSKAVVRECVKRHSKNSAIVLSEGLIDEKAIGVSYLVQNAIDYYDNASTENMTQRMLNLYYGSIAFMEAEMLIYGDQYKNLEEIEKVTKSGHGMRTFGDAVDLDDFFIGVIDKGLFYAWLKHRGVNVSDFPKKWDDCKKKDFLISLQELLCHIPELQNIMKETDKNYKPQFLFPSYEMELNRPVTLRKEEQIYQRKYYGCYIDFLNLEGETSRDVIEKFLAPITIIGPYNSGISGESGWRVFIRQKSNGEHYDSYQTHKGLSASQVIAPLFGKTDLWEVFAIMVLYAMSIIVRYMPNLWARILHGELDRYKAVFYQFSRVAERELTQIFLEILTDKTVQITHPSGLI